MTIKVTGAGKVQMKVLAAKLRGADPKLSAELRRAMRDQADPIVTDVQRSILTWRAEDPRTHLKSDIASTVRAETHIRRDGASLVIVSDGSRMPPGESTLPMHTDKIRWWHPVFAHGPRASWRWVPQTAKPRWFERPIRASKGRVQRALEDAAQRVADYLG